MLATGRRGRRSSSPRSISSSGVSVAWKRRLASAPGRSPSIRAVCSRSPSARSALARSVVPGVHRDRRSITNVQQPSPGERDAQDQRVQWPSGQLGNRHRRLLVDERAEVAHDITAVTCRRLLQHRAGVAQPTDMPIAPGGEHPVLHPHRVGAVQALDLPQRVGDVDRSLELLAGDRDGELRSQQCAGCAGGPRRRSGPASPARDRGQAGRSPPAARARPVARASAIQPAPNSSPSASSLIPSCGERQPVTAA